MTLAAFDWVRRTRSEPGTCLRLERLPDGLVELADEVCERPDSSCPLRTRATLVLLPEEVKWLHETLGMLLATPERR